MKTRQLTTLTMIMLVGPIAVIAQRAGGNQTQTVGGNQTVGVGSDQAAQDTAMAIIRKIGGVMEDMKKQQTILKGLIEAPSSRRFISTGPRSAGGQSAGPQGSGVRVASGDVNENQTRDAAMRSECKNNLKQMSLSVQSEAEKLATYFQGRNSQKGLTEARQLQASARRVGTAIEALPAKPNEQADREVLSELESSLTALEKAANGEEMNRMKGDFTRYTGPDRRR